MTIQTMNDLFYSMVERNLDCAMMVKRGSKWVSIASREFYRDVVGVARTLTEWGIGQGDRVAILSENRPEWAVADFAALLLGAVTVPIYTTLPAEQTLHLLRDSGARVLFVSRRELLSKISDIRDRCPLEKLVLMEDDGGAGIVAMESMMRRGPEGRDEEFDRRARTIGPEALATIIYTSGTTGAPKGVVLTQGNLACNLLHSLYLCDFREGQVSISFLPLSHVLARHVDYVMFWNGVTVAYCPSMDALMSVVAEVRPHIFIAVPRVYEKLYGRVRARFASGLKRKLYDWALAVGATQRQRVLEGGLPSGWRWRLADRIFFSKIKKVLGGRVELYISGGAALSREVLDWYASIGVRLYEGYGLTETSPIIAVSRPASYRFGSVGRVIHNVEVRLAEDDEILVKGPSVFREYWKQPEETATVFDGEWFRTGDVGRLDSDGFLYITDRKKDLIKTSGGKYIAPQLIEGKLKANPLVTEVAVIADGRKFPSAIIVPNFAALEEWARHHSVPFASHEELVAREEVLSLYEGIVDEVNRGLARFEAVKRFLLSAEDFSSALTPTMKLKRRVIEQRYIAQLDQLYAGEAKATRVG